MSFFSKNDSQEKSKAYEKTSEKTSPAIKQRTSGMSKKFYEGDIIFLQGDPIIDLFIIAKGEVQLYKKGGSGRIVPVGLLKQQEFLGVSDLFTTKICSITARALTDVELISVYGDDVEKIVNQLPDWVQKLTSTLSERLNSSKEILSEQGISDERLHSLKEFSNEEEVKIRKVIDEYIKNKKNN
ncbi:MAG: Crp/Fnr family transcriptional regulator [Oligoflexia bacterium]|nr:Crp/Fnr family transcriptional regulator [Oligoflexia bacterium]